MTLRELAELVQRTRDAQKEYFASRDPFVLRKSIDLEHELDTAVRDVLNPGLFG